MHSVIVNLTFRVVLCALQNWDFYPEIKAYIFLSLSSVKGSLSGSISLWRLEVWCVECTFALGAFCSPCCGCYFLPGAKTQIRSNRLQISVWFLQFYLNLHKETGIIVAFKHFKNPFLQSNLCIFKDVMHTDLHFCNNKLIKYVLLLTIFMSTL